MPAGASKNRGPDLAHGSWRLIGGLAAVSSARGGRRSPVVGAARWRHQAERERGVLREVHRLRSILARWVEWPDGAPKQRSAKVGRRGSLRPAGRRCQGSRNVAGGAARVGARHDDRVVTSQAGSVAHDPASPAEWAYRRLHMRTRGRQSGPRGRPRPIRPDAHVRVAQDRDCRT